MRINAPILAMIGPLYSHLQLVSKRIHESQHPTHPEEGPLAVLHTAYIQKRHFDRHQ